MNILWIAIGGGLGAISRYGIVKLISLKQLLYFPYATFLVNLIGSFLIGFSFAIFDAKMLPLTLRNFVSIGFLGAFTTFSTFTFDTMTLLRSGNFRTGLLNIILSNFLRIVFVFIGFAFSKQLIK